MAAVDFSATLDHIKGFQHVLTAIKQTKRQVNRPRSLARPRARLTRQQLATLVVDAQGLRIYTYDDSKSLQGCANLKREARAPRPRPPPLTPAQLFREFDFTPADGAFRKSFALSLTGLADSVAVFGAADGEAPLTLRWPDAHGRLLLQLNVTREVGKEGAPVACCTYAEVGCEEAGWAADLEGEMSSPQSSFTLPSATLRELVEDVSALAAAPVRVTLRRSPAGVQLSSHAEVAGSCTLRLAAAPRAGGASLLASFECVGESVSASYKAKFLRQAACMPPSLIAAAAAPGEGGAGGDASLSRVQMDGHGMLRIQHLLTLAPASQRGGRGRAAARQHAAGGGSAMDGSTLPDPAATDPGAATAAYGEGGGGITFVTFVLFSEQQAEEEDEEEGAERGEAEREGGSPLLVD